MYTHLNYITLPPDLSISIMDSVDRIKTVLIDEEPHAVERSDNQDHDDNSEENGAD